MTDKPSGSTADLGRVLRETALDQPATRPTLREIGKAIANEALRSAERKATNATERLDRKLDALCSGD